MSTARRFIRTLRFTIRPITAELTPRLRSVGASALRWALSGVAVGVGAAVGAAVTSTLIGTITLTAIRTSITSAAIELITATGSAAETARRSGSTTRGIEVV